VTTGRRLALDVGKVRIGVALSDFHNILASPQPHIERKSDEIAIDAILRLVTDEDVQHIYVGLPTNLRNESTQSTRDAVVFANLIALRTQVAITLVDERLTTTQASSALRSAGKSAKTQRAYIDSAAAAVILESALEFERNTGTIAGRQLGEFDA
jgi:putative Holliday junction resolvase